MTNPPPPSTSGSDAGTASAPVTLRAVAEAAGISTATASRVFNGSPVPTARTRQRVMEAAGQLGYRHDADASQIMRQRRMNERSPAGLSGGRNRLVALLTNRSFYERSHRNDSYYAEALLGIQQALTQWGYHLILEIVQPEQEAGITCVTQGKVEGVLCWSDPPEATRGWLDAYAPTVYLDREPPEVERETVAPDYAAAVRAQMQYLWDLGHRRIVRFEEAERGHTPQQRRRQGYAEFVRARGGDPPYPHLDRPRRTSGPGVEVESVLREWTQELLATTPRPTAIITTNRHAMSLMRYLQAEGIEVPRQISVLGINDNLVGEYTDPPLTSYRMPTRDVGWEGAELLVRRIEQPDRSRRHLRLEGRRIERASCAPPSDVGGEGDRHETGLTPRESGTGEPSLAPTAENER